MVTTHWHGKHKTVLAMMRATTSEDTSRTVILGQTTNMKNGTVLKMATTSSGTARTIATVYLQLHSLCLQ